MPTTTTNKTPLSTAVSLTTPPPSPSRSRALSRSPKSRSPKSLLAGSSPSGPSASNGSQGTLSNQYPLNTLTTDSEWESHQMRRKRQRSESASKDSCSEAHLFGLTQVPKIMVELELTKLEVRFAIREDRSGKIQLVLGREGSVTSTILSHLHLGNGKDDEFKCYAAGNLHFVRSSTDQSVKITDMSNKSGDYKPPPYVLYLLLHCLNKLPETSEVTVADLVIIETQRGGSLSEGPYDFIAQLRNVNAQQRSDPEIPNDNSTFTQFFTVKKDQIEQLEKVMDFTSLGNRADTAYHFEFYNFDPKVTFEVLLSEAHNTCPPKVTEPSSSTISPGFRLQDSDDDDDRSEPPPPAQKEERGRSLLSDGEFQGASLLTSGRRKRRGGLFLDHRQGSSQDKRRFSSMKERARELELELELKR